MEYRWSGKKICLEDGSVRLRKVLSRRLVFNLGECVIVAEGVIDGTDGPVIAKLRVELDPDDDLEGSHYEEVAKRGCAEEIIALGEVARFRAYASSVDLPEQNVEDILFNLEEDEEDSIEARLAEVLEYMRQWGYCYVDPRQSNLIWNQENRKLYLVDLGAATLFNGGEEEIGPKSNAVKVFMISKWSRHSRG
ncbi:MAG: hypothetical protein M1840_004744 [Geoglossum simile]|nr:MAG: hypothetical protein M1840_004744 [Geoglossum simile]